MHLQLHHYYYLFIFDFWPFPETSEKFVAAGSLVCAFLLCWKRVIVPRIYRFMIIPQVRLSIKHATSIKYDEASPVSFGNTVCSGYCFLPFPE